MKVKLSSKDVLELTKAIKQGELNTDGVDVFKRLADGYKPFVEIKESEHKYYLDCLYKGWGIMPNSEGDFIAMLKWDNTQEWFARHEYYINNGQFYKDYIKHAYIGILALWGVGFEIDWQQLANQDLDFLKKPIPKFDY